MTLTIDSSADALKTGQAKLWIVLIGVQHYDDQRFASLRYSAIDCQGLADALVEVTGAFPQKAILIHHDSAPTAPTFEAVRSSLQTVANQAQAEDTVLIYFCGHSALESRFQQVVLCLADTQQDNLLKTGLSMMSLLGFLGQCAAKHQILWLDTGHELPDSVPTRFDDSTPQLIEMLRQRSGQNPGFFALLSFNLFGKNRLERSWKSAELGHGVFTYFLIKGLRGEAADARGIVDVEKLYQYVHDQTAQYVEQFKQNDSATESITRSQTPRKISRSNEKIVLGIQLATANNPEISEPSRESEPSATPIKTFQPLQSKLLHKTAQPANATPEPDLLAETLRKQRLEEEQRQREEQRRRKEEAQRQQQEVLRRQRLAEEEQRQQREEQRQQQEEILRRQRLEEQEQRRQQEEILRRQYLEEQERRKQQEAERKQQEEILRRQRLEEQEQRKRQEELLRRQRLEAEAQRKQQEEILHRQRLEAEAQRKQQEEILRRQQLEEEAQRKQQLQQEAQRQRAEKAQRRRQQIQEVTATIAQFNRSTSTLATQQSLRAIRSLRHTTLNLIEFVGHQQRSLTHTASQQSTRIAERIDRSSSTLTELARSQQQNPQFRRRVVRIAGGVGLTASAIALLAAYHHRNAELQAIGSLSTQSETLLAANQSQAAIVAALKAGAQLQQLDRPWNFLPDPVRIRTATTLQQALRTAPTNTNINATVAAISPDGEWIATANADASCSEADPCRIALWKPNATAPQRIFKGHTASITQLRFSSDGKRLASASDDKTAKLWDVEKGILIKTLVGHSDRVTAVSFRSDGSVLATGSADRSVKLWAIPNGRLVETLKGNEAAIRVIRFNSDDSILATGSDDNTIRLWYPDSPKPFVMGRPGNSGGVSDMMFSPDGKTIAAASNEAISLWKMSDATPDREVSPERTLSGGRALALSFNPPGTVLASAGEGGTRIWDAQNGTLIKTLSEPQNAKIQSVLFNTKGDALISVNNRAQITVWNLNLASLIAQGCDRIRQSPDFATVCK